MWVVAWATYGRGSLSWLGGRGQLLGERGEGRGFPPSPTPSGGGASPLSGNEPRRQNETHHRHQLDDDVQRRSTRVLERVAYRVAYHRRFVGV